MDQFVHIFTFSHDQSHIFNTVTFLKSRKLIRPCKIINYIYVPLTSGIPIINRHLAIFINYIYVPLNLSHKFN